MIPSRENVGKSGPDRERFQMYQFFDDIHQNSDIKAQAKRLR